jgi:arylsulfatase A-like enzyme
VDHVVEAEAVYDRVAFQSFRKDGLLASPITMSGETRRALTPPLPSRLSFDIRVPPDPTLRFAIGSKILGDAVVWPAVDFILSIDTGRDEQVLFEESVRRARPNQWFDREVDLKPWSGKNVRLTFETRLHRTAGRVPWTARGVLPVWGNPVLLNESWRGRRPNIILISVDCLRPDHMSAYGYERLTTPHIDAMVEDGVLFENATSTSTWTLPGHMSMLTGLPPSLHRANKWEKLDSSIPYLAEILASSGYQVDGIASWVYVSQAFGFERGFHLYRVLDQPRADRVIDEALDLVRRARGANQFLFIHLFDPHWPYLPPVEFRESFAARPPDISGLLDTIGKRIAPTRDDQIQQAKDLYDAEIAFVDREIGRFLGELEAAGLYDESLIILTADHGEAFWEHGHWQHTDTLFDEIIRVPMIVKWPGSSMRGRCGAQVNLVDLFPTFVESAGIDYTHGRGENLKARFEDCAQVSSHRNVISENTWRSPEGSTMKISLRSPQYKYIATLAVPEVGNPGSAEIEGEELYHLVEDPDERLDVSGDSEGIIRVFRDELLTYIQLAARERTVPANSVTLDDATKEQLRSLGYVVY